MLPTLEIAPHYLVRVAQLPLQKWRRLRLRRVGAALKRILEAEDWLRQDSRSLCDALYQAVPVCRSDSDRRRLIELKRNVHNLRAIERDQFLSVEKLLPANLRSRLTEWVAKQQEYRNLIEQGPQILGDELQLRRRQLKNLCRQPDFLNAILLSNPGLIQVIERYCSSDDAVLGKRERQAEMTIAGYLARMATRATPLSTFAGVGYGFWDSRPGSPELRFSRHARRSGIRLNDSLLREITRRLSESPRLRPYLRLFVNPALRRRNGQMHWVRTRISCRLSGRMLEKQVQEFARLKSSPLAAQALSLVEEGHAELLCGELVEALAARTGLSRHRAQEVVDKLIDLHLLECRLTVADICPHPLNRLIEAMAQIPDPQAQQARRRLQTLASLLRDFSQAPYDERVRLLAEIRQVADELCKEVSIPLGPNVKNLLYEDLGLNLLCSNFPQAPFQSAIRELDLLCRLVALFDMSTIMNCLAARFFVQRYGGSSEGVDLLDFYRDFLLQFKASQSELVPEDIVGLRFAPFQSTPELERLRRLQADLNRLLESLSDQDGEEVVLDYQRLRRFVEPLQDDFPPAPGTALLCQIAKVGKDEWIVIQRILPGLGRYLSRFHYLFGDQRQNGANPLLKSVRRFGRRVQGDDRLFADLGGGFGFNGNLRPLQTDCSIHYPGTVPLTPRQQTIPLSDLQLRYHQEQKRFSFLCKRTGRQIVPVDLGFMFIFSQPPLYQFLSLISPARNISGPPLLRFPAPQGGSGRHFPRVRLGNLILRRRRWVLHPSDIPQRRQGEPEFQLLLRLRRWQRNSGLPDEAYLHIPSTNELAQWAEDRARHTANGQPKGTQREQDLLPEPLHVQFADYFSLQNLLRLSRRAPSDIILEEVLPGAEDMVVRQGPHKHFSEFLIELAYCRSSSKGEPAQSMEQAEEASQEKSP